MNPDQPEKLATETWVQAEIDQAREDAEKIKDRLDWHTENDLQHYMETTNQLKAENEELWENVVTLISAAENAVSWVGYEDQPDSPRARLEAALKPFMQKPFREN